MGANVPPPLPAMASMDDGGMSRPAKAAFGARAPEAGPGLTKRLKNCRPRP